MSLLKKRKRHHLGNRIDFTKHLFSDELILGTFAYLTALDLIECGKVNHVWSRLARDAGLWRPLFEERFDRPLSTFKAKWNPLAEYQLPYANWKDQYRIHQNWLTGYCTSSHMNNIPAPSSQPHTWHDHQLQSLIQYTNDILCIISQYRKHVDIWHTGNTTTQYIGYIKDDTLDGRQKITYMKLKLAGLSVDEHGRHQKKYTLFLGNNYGGFSAWAFTTIAATATESSTSSATASADITETSLTGIQRTCHYNNNHKDPVIAIDTLHSILVLCTTNMVFQAFDIDQSPPRQIFKLESPVRWSPVVVHLSRHHLASHWKALLCFGVDFGSESSLGAQEMIFSAHGLTSSRHSSIYYPFASIHGQRAIFRTPSVSSNPTSASTRSSPPPRTNSTAFDTLFPEAANNAGMTTMVYSDPFIMTAYATNTIRQFRVISTDDDFRVEFVKTLFGHTCRVSSLALDVGEGRLISGSRSGLKIWDLLSLDQYKKRANDYVVNLQAGPSAKTDIPLDDIIWLQMDKVKIVALLMNGVTKKTWFKIWSFDL